MRHRSGFWAATFAFLIVMAVATLPSPLYGLYRTRDHLSALTITVVFAIFAASTIVVLQRDSFIAGRIGLRGTMIAAVGTMIVAMGVLAAWKDLPGLLIGRLITGVSVGLAAGTAITYLVGLRLHADPEASATRARTIGTSVTVGALGIGPLIAGGLAQWVTAPLTVPYLVFIALGLAALLGLWAAPETAPPATGKRSRAAPSASPACSNASSRRREPAVMPLAAGPTAIIRSCNWPGTFLSSRVRTGSPDASASRLTISACAVAFRSQSMYLGRQHACSTLSRRALRYCGLIRRQAAPAAAAHTRTSSSSMDPQWRQIW